MKLHIKKGDTVKVLAGNARGEKGRVLEVMIKDNRAIVEGLNMVTKHSKKTQANPDGGIIKKEAPIHLSNLMVVDNQGNATRTTRRKNDDGKLVRFSKKSGEEIK